MDNKFLDEVLEIARKEWKGTVEREEGCFYFKTHRLGGVGFRIKAPWIDKETHRMFETPAYIWLAIETQLERAVSEHARNQVFTKTVEEKNREVMR